MAIRLTTKATDRTLFCSSKWWGSPDLPPDVEYPTMKVLYPDGTTDDYPLTFICQIDCADIAPLDPEGELPHEGMLYFFAAIDDFTGYESPEHFPLGRWEKKAVVVKYTKSINFETFCQCVITDEDDNDVAEPERAIEFSACGPLDDGIKLLGLPFFEEVRSENEGCLNLLQLDEDDDLGLRFYDCGNFNILLKESDLRYGNFKRAFGYLHSL